MPRIVLQFLLALSLVLQGPLPVLAAAAARAQADDCMQAMSHGDAAEKKAPCCIGDCAPSACLQACIAGSAVFIVPASLDWTASDLAGAALTPMDARPPGRDESPPIRPPIA
jgi:hypothetical protein